VAGFEFRTGRISKQRFDFSQQLEVGRGPQVGETGAAIQRKISIGLSIDGKKVGLYVEIARGSF